MLNEAHLDKIRRLIQASTLLNDQEKNDWLALLDLMNDKQLTELEEILATDQEALTKSTIPQPKPTPIKKITQPAPSKPLPQPKPKPVLPKSDNVDFSSSSQLPPQSQPPVNLPKPTPNPKPIPAAKAILQTTSSPQKKSPDLARVTPLHHIQNLPSQFTAPTASAAPKTPSQESSNQHSIAPKPAAKPVGIAKEPAHKSYAKQGQAQLRSYEDLSKLNSGIFDNDSVEQITNTLRSLASQYGYLAVLNQLEQSPLYEEYLDFGKSKLSGLEPSTSLTEEQFSVVTDLLLALKVNRS